MLKKKIDWDNPKKGLLNSKKKGHNIIEQSNGATDSGGAVHTTVPSKKAHEPFHSTPGVRAAAAADPSQPER